MSTKICPHCESEIQAEAKKCRYCKEWIEGSKENIAKENKNNQEIIEKQKIITPEERNIKVENKIDTKNTTEYISVKAKNNSPTLNAEEKRILFIILGIVVTIVVSWISISYYSWYKENISYNVNKWDSVELQLPLHTQILSFIGWSDEVDLLNIEIRGCGSSCYWSGYGSREKKGEELEYQNKGRMGYWNKSGNFWEKHTIKLIVRPQKLTSSIQNINLTTGQKGDEGVLNNFNTDIEGNYFFELGYQGAENQDKYKYLQNNLK